MKGFTTTT